uniref:Uncharacterized protein n=1 Tax=Saimiri boliviensis boliviensis TaxID=39432 RepID=A0A2K6SXX6_SAIBB
MCQYVMYSFSSADFNSIQKDPQWSDRETSGNSSQCILHKQAKQNTTGVSGK